MRRLLICLFVLLSATGLRAQDAVTAADRAAIAETIQGQIHAFGRDDAEAAFGYAAPSIRQMFGDAGLFIAMVRQGYAPVYRPTQVDFSELEQRGEMVIQKVELLGPDGRPVLAIYTMERQPDGSWKIAGCALARSERVGA